MTPPPHPPFGAPLRFSTDGFAERERLTAWREFFCRGFAKLDAEPLHDIPFQARMAMRIMPDLVVVSGRGRVRKTARTRELLADGSDTMVFQIASCANIASQRGRDVAAAPGEAVLLSNADLGSATFETEQSVIVLNLPRAVLRPSLHDLDAVLTRPVPNDNEALRLLKAYLAAIEHDPAPTSEDLQRLMVAHVHDLVALALGATADAAEIARTRGLRAARLGAAKTYVMRHLGQFDLSAATVAAHLGVTPRYVYMLFEAEGVSFSEFVLGERLARAHRMLGALRHAGDTISAIAYAAGFSDLSHFNRSFRRRFGCTPSDARAAARNGGRGDGEST
jgi:AraC-like DNA-binding protein